MGTIVSQITSLTIVYSTKIRENIKDPRHLPLRGPVNSPHKWPVTRKMFPFDDVIMVIWLTMVFLLLWNGGMYYQFLSGLLSPSNIKGMLGAAPIILLPAGCIMFRNHHTITTVVSTKAPFSPAFEWYSKSVCKTFVVMDIYTNSWSVNIFVTMLSRNKF